MCAGKRVWPLAFCMVIVGCSRAPSAPEAETTGPPASKEEITWESFRPENGGFTVLMPGKPANLSYDTDSVIYGVQLPGETEFTVAWSDHSSEVATIGAEAALEVARDSQTLLQDRQLLTDKPLVVQGHPARDVASVNTDGFVLHCRMIIAGDRLYQLAWVTEKANYSPADPALTKFLESFKLNQ